MSFRRQFKRKLCGVIAAYSIFSYAGEFNFEPSISTEAAAFKNDHGLLTEDQIFSFIPLIKAGYGHLNFNYSLKAAYRFDTFDKKRDLLFIGDNKLTLTSDDGNHRIEAGQKRLQLGALEIFQSLDLVNDTISDSFTSDIQKSGYPMASYRYTHESFKTEAYYFPLFYAPYYPKNSSRLGYGLQFDKEQAISTSGDKVDEGFNLNQYGFKLDIPSETVDLSLGHFHFIDRSLSIVALDNNNEISRYFFPVDLSFVTAQFIYNNHLFKGNFYHKNFHDNKTDVKDIISGSKSKLGPEDHSIISLGYETKIPILKGQDTTALLEQHKLIGIDHKLARRYSIFSNDFSYGIRHQLGDLKGKQITLIHIIDLEITDEQIFQADYKQSITDNMKITLGTRFIKAGKRNKTFSFDNLTGLALMDDADTIYLSLTNYF